MKIAKIRVCPRCKGDKEVYGGYWTHPETCSSGRYEPMMVSCSLCYGTGSVAEDVALKEICSKIMDIF